MTKSPTSIRLDPEIDRKIQALIDSGDFGSRTEFIMYAIRITLRDYSGRFTPPPINGDRGRRGGIPEIVYSSLRDTIIPTIPMINPTMIRSGMIPIRSIAPFNSSGDPITVFGTQIMNG